MTAAISLLGALGAIDGFSRDKWLLISSARGAKSDVACAVRELLRGRVHSLSFEGRPTPVKLRDLVTAAGRPDIVVGVGGGSVIDATKFVAMATAHENSIAWLEHWLLNGGMPSPPMKVPTIVAIPTLVGSSAEVTPFATLWLTNSKRSLEHSALKPATVVQDVSNLAGAPYHALLFAALDAMSHAFESLWNRNATVESDALASSALTGLVSLLPNIWQGSTSLNLTPLFEIAANAGRAIAITQTALAHAISYPLTCELNVPHGLACSFALPEVAAFNISTNAQRLAPAAASLRCTIKEIPGVIESLFCRIGFSAIVRQYLSNDAIEGIHGQFADGPRSGNNIRPVTNAQARSLAWKATERAWN